MLYAEREDCLEIPSNAAVIVPVTEPRGQARYLFYIYLGLKPET